MKISQIYKFFSAGRSSVPYTTLSEEELPDGEKMHKRPYNATELSILPPFREMLRYKKPDEGQIITLGMISTGLLLSGLTLIVEAKEKKEKASKKKKTNKKTNGKAGQRAPSPPTPRPSSA